MKKVLTQFILYLIITMTLLLSAMPLCCAEENTVAKLIISRQIQKGKSVVAQIKTDTSFSFNVLVLKIRFGEGLTFTQCHVADGTNGNMITTDNNGCLNITFIGAENQKTDNSILLNVTVKAVSDIPINSFVEFSLTDGSDGKGNLLLPYTEHFDIDIVDKITASSAAVGRKTTSSETDTSTKTNTKNRHSAVSATVPQQKQTAVETAVSSQNIQTVTEIQLSDNTAENPPLAVYTDGTTLFIAGGLCCFGIIAVIFISYTIGKKQTKNNLFRENRKD